MDFLLTKPFCLSVCVRACVCLGLVLLLVRWVSVKRITTVSLLYPHTLSQRPTFTRPTFHTIQPPPAALFDGDLKKKKKTLNFYLGYKRQNNIFSYSDSVAEAGLKWSMYVELETIFWRSCKAIEANRWNSPRFVFLGIDTAQHNSVYYMHISERDTGVCVSY